MRIKSISIQNFRSAKKLDIELDDYTSLVGPNGGGKSTILNALNVLFRNNTTSSLECNELTIDDFHLKNTSEPIKISATFDQLSNSAKSDLKAYIRQNQLTISAVATWNKKTETAPVLQFGERLVNKDFSDYFAKEEGGAPATELRSIYAKLQKSYQDLPAETVKANMHSALRTHEEANPKDCKLVPSKDQFYGFSKGSNRLAEHIQWIFVPAVKDASSEESASSSKALKALVARTAASKIDFTDALDDIRKDAVGKYENLINKSQSSLDELSTKLTQRIKTWAHPGAGIKVVWTNEKSKGVSVTDPVATVLASEQDHQSDIGRMGHGLQRSYLLALLQEMVESADDKGPSLILAIEEPELFQHPPQIRHMSGVLQRLSKTGTQIAICTHSPLFITGDRYSDVRCVKLEDAKRGSTCTAIDPSKIDTALANARNKNVCGPKSIEVRLQKSLQPNINELFFSPYVVLVEGIEDEAYIKTWLELSNRMDDFRKQCGHIIQCNSKGYITEPLSVLNELGSRKFVVFDMDGDREGDERTKHESDNLAILKLLGHDNVDAFSSKSLLLENCAAWPENIGKIIQAEVGEDDWKNYQNTVRKEHSLHVPGTKKSPMFIGLTLSLIHADGVRIPVLDQLCDKLVADNQ